MSFGEAEKWRELSDLETDRTSVGATAGRVAVYVLRPRIGYERESFVGDPMMDAIAAKLRSRTLDRQSTDRRDGQRIERDTVDSPDLEKLLHAMSDPRWDFRTVDGLCRSTKLPRRHVESLLRNHDDLFRVSLVPDKKGRRLFTLRSRGMKLQEMMANLRAFVAKSVT